MSSPQELYEQRKTTHAELIRGLRSGVSIATGNCSAKAHRFLSALSEYGGHLSELTLVLTNTFEERYPIFFRPGTRIVTSFLGVVERAAAKQCNNVDFQPNQFCDGIRYLRSGQPGRDVLIYMTGPMDADGYFNHGLTAGVEVESIQRYAGDPRTLVVVEANQQMPHVLGLEEFGGHRFHVSQVDHVIEIDEPISELARQAPAEIDRRLADHVVDLVEDEATVQFGIGALPDCVAQRLQTKQELGVHSEMIGDGCMELILSGAVTNSHKTEHRGRSIGTFALGTRQLYDWMNHNPAVRLLPVMHVNHPPVLARQHKMTSINSILQIDLRGQATAHCLQGRTYSGMGGHFEYTYGAQLSPGGKSILCLRSSADLPTGRVSNIVPILPQGTAISVPEFIVDWVVTEYGAVHLKWLTLPQRAARLILISHPDFREQLTDEARRRGIIA